MRVLLTEGSSLSARQIVWALGARGCEVQLLDAGRTPLARFSRHVTAVHRVPPVGDDPFAWLEAALGVVARIRPAVLLASHEQAAVLAWAQERIAATGVGVAVPSFASLAQVQDKLAATRLLDRLRIDQPLTVHVTSAADLRRLCVPPVYLKARVATASTGVLRVSGPAGVDAAVARFAGADGGVLVQQVADGPLAMVQAVFERGRLVAHHAALRVREGASGSASAKRSIALDPVAEQLARLGERTAWHGALSVDVVLTGEGPSWIDINPRLVEPGNAQRSGVDLVGALLDLSLGRPCADAGVSRTGVMTHQLLVAVLGAAEAGRGRRGVLGELLGAGLRRGPYAGSAEELLAVRADPVAAVPLAAVCASLMLRPSAARELTRGTVGRYALTPAAWKMLCDRAATG